MAKRRQKRQLPEKCVLEIARKLCEDWGWNVSDDWGGADVPQAVGECKEFAKVLQKHWKDCIKHFTLHVVFDLVERGWKITAWASHEDLCDVIDETLFTFKRQNLKGENMTKRKQKGQLPEKCVVEIARKLCKDRRWVVSDDWRHVYVPQTVEECTGFAKVLQKHWKDCIKHFAIHVVLDLVERGWKINDWAAYQDLRDVIAGALFTFQSDKSDRRKK